MRWQWKAGSLITKEKKKEGFWSEIGLKLDSRRFYADNCNLTLNLMEGECNFQKVRGESVINTNIRGGHCNFPKKIN